MNNLILAGLFLSLSTIYGFYAIVTDRPCFKVDFWITVLFLSLTILFIN